ncbi:hypothetical protein B7494_g8275 [Chlorociboria aeruginascens]|nr:hypothetical protein B7494_g8275 [Chlorociboria aeruginascens]
MSTSASAPEHQVPDWEAPRPTNRTFLSRVLGNAKFTPAPDLAKETESSESPTQKLESAPPPAYEAAFPPTQVSPPAKRTWTEKFNEKWPENCTYFGRSRKTVMSSLIALVLLIALVIGLAVGLSRHHKKSEDLPLPSNIATFTGDLTYYAPGLGACGIVSSASDNICAVSHIIFDAASTSGNPNANPLCGKMIRIRRDKGDGQGTRSVDVKVVDRCVGCAAVDLDLSLGVFEELAYEAQGRVQGTWAWLE